MDRFISSLQQQPHKARIKGPFKLPVLGVSFVEIQLSLPLMAHYLADHFFKGKAGIR